MISEHLSLPSADPDLGNFSIIRTYQYLFCLSSVAVTGLLYNKATNKTMTKKGCAYIKCCNIKSLCSF